LARLRGFTVVNFGLFAAIGAAVGVWVTILYQLQQQLLVSEFALLMYGITPLAIVLGSRIHGLLLDWRLLLEDPGRALAQTTFAFYGGVAATTVAVLCTVEVHDIPVMPLLDSFALGLPLGHAIGRVGCLTYGCCHGRPTAASWSIRFTNPESKVVWYSKLADVRLHPTQLYECLGGVAVFALLVGLAMSSAPSGALGAGYLMLASALRFGVEFLRTPPRPVRGKLNSNQAIAFGLFLLGAVVGLAIWGDAPARPIGAPLSDALAESARYAPLLVWSSAIVFVAFGIHGPRVGRLDGLQSSKSPRAGSRPHTLSVVRAERSSRAGAFRGFGS
jgi:phosphatidylglycerol:prolipoprotein diacylglycerol transferase